MDSSDNMIEKASKYIDRLYMVGDVAYKFSHISPKIAISEQSEFDAPSSPTNYENPMAILIAEGKPPIMKSLRDVIAYFEQLE